MKTIINKETEVKSEKGNMSRADLIKLVAENPIGDKGINTSEMRTRLKIIEAIEKAGTGDIVLEDAEFELLKRSYDVFPWARPHKHIIELADHLEDIAKTK